MKKIVLAILLACAMAAATQVATQAQTAPPQNPPAAQGASGNAPAESAPTIKDPAEYNAYVAAYQQKDPNAKVSALEAFLTQYPNSVMKNTALELLMSTYQQTGNQAKIVDSAKRLIEADPCNLRALAVLTYLARQAYSSGQNPQENLASLAQYAGKGAECTATAPKPAMLSGDDWEKLKKQVGPIFDGGAGFAALQNKDYAGAKTHLRKAVEAQPDDLQNVYPLALAYLTPNPRSDEDTLNGLFFMARSVNLSNGNADLQKFLVRTYKNFHGSEDGINDLLACAKANPTPTADCPKITKYVPPTPAEQAHDLVNGKTPEQIQQLSFGEWELVLSAGTPEDQDKVWSVIKGKPLQMEGNVIAVDSNTQLQIAASADDIDAKRTDITLTMNGPIPAAKMPKAGDVFDFEGVPTSYTPNPFMMMMEQGKLLKKAGAPAPKKPPVHRHPVHKPTAQ
jgi:tetratricopeptide (TPR) repeat protein